MAVWQEEVNSGRADLISIMYFALFILEQLKEEVDTMMSGGLKQRWVGELLAHTNMSTDTLKPIYTHKCIKCCMNMHLQGLQVQESSKTVVSYLLYSVVMKMPGKAKALLHTSVRSSHIKSSFTFIIGFHHFDL